MKTPPLLPRLGLAALALLALSACSKKADPAADASGAAAPRTILIGFIGKSQTNDVFQAAHAGARDAAAELGAKYGVKVEIEIRTPNDEDATKQAEAIDALVRRGAQGISVSASEAATVTPSIDKAVARGVAVMCFDSDAPDSKRFAFYGTDDFSCGERIMENTVKALGGKGVVAILGGNQSAPNLQKRVEGAKAAAARHPGIKLNTPSAFYHVETPEKSAEAVSSAQNANPGIQGWAFIGGWPLFTADALKWAPGSIKVASCDALPAQLDYLRSGHVDTLFAQDCYGWGYKSVEILLEKIVNGNSPDTVRVVDPLTEVTKANVDAFAKNWEKWLAK
jgi:ribose transport system substrate-binding protein